MRMDRAREMGQGTSEMNKWVLVLVAVVAAVIGGLIAQHRRRGRAEGRRDE
jgi:hypothetical protein